MKRPYQSLALAIFINFFIMWALTYIGVWSFDHVYLNLNRFYMAIVMVAPMLIVMLTVMSPMYDNVRLNIGIYVVSTVVFVAAIIGIQAQAFVGDVEMSRSMIPHHSIAIKTCERAELDDPETIQLCDDIIEAQKEEIAQMEGILARLD